ncbi:hypothetical protein [Paraflavitalea speifideaquila]|uniref:hypothetical protein n=1 Tax=Paraflavitalea speifideaquila TaxID=3076558 RepID=UPI0028EAF413|nr:hypothetical protein [Paraflavitalea speifideiaquila]
MLAPFLQILFGLDKDAPTTAPDVSITSFDVLDYLKYLLRNLIDTYGHSRALAAVCITVVLAILFKNLFLYLSYRVIIPSATGL